MQFTIFYDPKELAIEKFDFGAKAYILIYIDCTGPNN